jgi:hypothetical protein
MKKIGLVITLVAAVGLVCVTFAQPAEAFFFGGGGCGSGGCGGGGLFKAGGLFGGGGIFGGGYGSGSGYGMPYYGSYGYYPGYKCKAMKKKAKKAKPMMKKAK